MVTMLRILTAFVLLCPAGVTASLADWPQFGGPHRNWHSDSTGLASVWPADGPKRLWKRELGDGYSGISVENGTLYTMYRRGNQEVVTALDAKSGKTVWEYAYNAAFMPRMAMENGPGPHGTPLVVGNRVFTVGILANLLCLDKATGKLVWSKDLYKDFPGSTHMGRGYAGSPLAYKNTIIVTLGGPGHAVVALNQKDGSLAWGSNDSENSPSSPVLINVDGEDQLVAFMGDRVVGLNPNNGEFLWSHAHKTDWGLNIALPVYGDDHLLFLSSAYHGGSRVLQLKKEGAKTTVKELWSSNRIRVHHGTAVRVGDVVYGSSGDFGPAPLTAVDVKTGKVMWQDRAFPKATFVYADGKFVVLDEDGTLALATFAPEGLKIISKVTVLNNKAWTAPSLVGTKLYIRDRRYIMALDLS